MQLVNDAEFRQGDVDDESWLFQLFKDTMQDYIDAAWGWEELLQKEGFVTSLPARNFRILQLGEHNIACIYLSDRDDHLVLDMLLVAPAWQRQGFGSTLVDWAKARAAEGNKRIRLSVLKTNPAAAFHLAHGFEAIEEDDHSLKMEWTPGNG